MRVSCGGSVVGLEERGEVCMGVGSGEGSSRGLL